MLCDLLSDGPARVVSKQIDGNRSARGKELIFPETGNFFDDDASMLVSGKFAANGGRGASSIVLITEMS
jgi:hypothetical protein